MKLWSLFNLIFLSAVMLASTESERSKKPNILLMVADDLGYSDLGCYGGEIATPHLDRLAEKGIRFTQFYNAGRCCPSRASILTGHYPHRVGLGHMTKDIHRPEYRGSVSEKAPVIAEVLKPHGYHSFIAGKWHLGTEDPTQHGFKEFYGTLVSAKRFFDPDHLLRLPEGRQAIEYPEGSFYATDAVTDHALEFLNRARTTPEKPWFLYLAYHAPHFPLHAPDEDIQKYKDRYLDGWDVLRSERLERMKKMGLISKETELPPRSEFWNYGETRTGLNPDWKSLPQDRRQDLARRMAIYAAMIDRMDQQIGRVLSDLKKNREWENTLIFFISDNGACAEWDPYGFDIKSSNQNILHKGVDLDKMGGPGTFHSIGSGWANAANTPWRLYKHFNHEGGINSPCIVHWPKELSDQAGTLNATPTHIIDLLPTILKAVDARYDGPWPLPGTDMIANRLMDRKLFFEHEGNRAVRAGVWKLVALRGRPWELYDFSEVRTELKDISGQHPNLTEELSNHWNQWAKEQQVTPLPQDYEVDYLRVEIDP